MTTLIELAERVEKLTGPCRETDALIVIALDLRPEWCGKGGKLWVDLETMPTDPPIRYAYNGKRSKGNPPIGHYKEYTASLDAAMTLVQEGCDFYFEVEQVMGGFCNYLYITGGGSLAPSHDLRGKGGKPHPTWKDAVAALPREISAAALRARHKPTAEAADRVRG